MAKNIILAGFHAVGARLRKDPDSIVCVYVDPQRRDKRMSQMRAELESLGVRVMQAGHDRLNGMVSGDIPHQGIVAMAKPLEVSLTFDELMDEIRPDSLFLILDGITDPRNFGACLRSADAAGVHAVIIPKDRSATVTPGGGKGGGRRCRNGSCCDRDEFGQCHCRIARCRCDGGGRSRRSHKDNL